MGPAVARARGEPTGLLVPRARGEPMGMVVPRARGEPTALTAWGEPTALTAPHRPETSCRPVKAGSAPVAPPGGHIDVNEFKDAPHTGWGDGRTDPPPESDGTGIGDLAYSDEVPIVDESIAWDVDPDAPIHDDDAAFGAPEPDSGDIDWGDA